MEEKNKQLQHVKGVIESLLFVNERPVTLDQLKKVLENVSVSEIKGAIQLLQKDHEENFKGTTVIEIAGGYQMLSNPIYAEYIRNFYKTKHKEKLSKPALETLAIMAYKQPVTRADVEMIRGVNSDGVVGNLLEKELIKIVGRKDVPGRPYMYGTTKQFLEYFGLKSLETLPKLEEFPVLQQRLEEVDAKLSQAAQEKASVENVSQETAVSQEFSENQESDAAYSESTEIPFPKEQIEGQDDLKEEVQDNDEKNIEQKEDLLLENSEKVEMPAEDVSSENMENVERNSNGENPSESIQPQGAENEIERSA